MTASAMPAQASSTAPADPMSVDEACERLRIDGYVMLEGIVPPGKLERARVAYERDILGPATRTAPNRGTNRWQAFLPFRDPYCDPEIWAHPLVLDVVARVLGEDALLQVISSDTPLAGSDYQGVHTDVVPLYPGLELTLPPHALGLTIPMVDVTAENGPMEFWPGTHQVMSQGIDVERAAKARPSVMPLSRVGTVMLRDFRAWHRGTPNRTAAPRSVIGFAFVRSWFSLFAPVSVPERILAGMSERCRRMLRRSPTTRD
jgi:ectoine hydroxylase-related dioxygenase (phytanoyl-CoA dioxygenase family)